VSIMPILIFTDGMIRRGPDDRKGVSRSPCVLYLLHYVSALLSLTWLIDEESESFVGNLIIGI
jgi:hypothetical protein